MSVESKSEKDLFRDTPVRLLGYANEVGEAFRGFLSTRAVNFTYGVASTYVVADAVHKAIDAYSTSSKETRKGKVLLTFCDVLLWQTFASVIIPGLLINRVCYATKFCLKNMKIKKINNQYLVSIAGLAAIPFIIQPIDHSVDYVMDQSFRSYFNLKDNPD